MFDYCVTCLATYTLTQPVRGAGRGSFVGYSAAGPPLYSFAGDTLQRTSQSMMVLARSGLRQILDESDSRRIFYFLCINLVSTISSVICCDRLLSDCQLLHCPVIKVSYRLTVRHMI